MTSNDDMRATEPASGAGFRLGLQAFAAGFTTDWLLYYLLRIQNTKVIIGYALPVILCTALAGVVIGGLRASSTPRRAVGGPWWSIATLIFAVAIVFHQGVPAYYPRFPDMPPALPDPVWAYALSLATAVLFAVAPFTVVAERYARCLAETSRPAMLTAIQLGGFGAGGVLAWLSVGTLGGYMGLLIGLIAVLLMVDGRRLRTVMLVGLAVVMAWSTVKPPRPFMWALEGGRVLESTWSSYNKLEFVAFDGLEHDKDCLASIYNDNLLYYTCPHGDEDHFQRTKFWKALVPGRDRMLVVGASGGMAMLSCMLNKPDMKGLVGVEIDPVVVERFKNEYSAYNGEVFLDPRVEVIPGEGRAVMERLADAGERFDLIFHDGIDARLYSFWQSGVPMENYVFTREGITLALDRLLTDNGVLFIDIGGVDRDGAQFYLDAMPEGAHATVAWYAVSSYPMVGLPLFLVVMSRNPDAIAQVAEGFRAIPSMVPMTMSRNADAIPSVDDRPFPARPDYLEWPMLLLILALVCGVPLLLRARRRLLELDLEGQSAVGGMRPLLGLLIMGAGGGLIQSVLVSRLARAFEGPSLGTAIIVASFIGGAALAGVVASKLGRERSGVPFAAIGLLIGGLCTAFASGLVGSDVPSVLAACSLAAAAGLGASVLWPLAVERIPAAARTLWFAVESLGFVWGIALCQVALFFLGYRATGFLGLGMLVVATGALLAWVGRQEALTRAEA